MNRTTRKPHRTRITAQDQTERAKQERKEFSSPSFWPRKEDLRKSTADSFCTSAIGLLISARPPPRDRAPSTLGVGTSITRWML